MGATEDAAARRVIAGQKPEGIAGWGTRPGLALVLLVAASAGLRFWAASRIPSPWITPDEQTYGELGRSLWRSGRFEILGSSTEPLSLVHPALIGAPLAAI